MMKPKAIIAIACLAIGLSAYALRVTPEQVRSCVDVTGWNEARCLQELGR